MHIRIVYQVVVHVVQDAPGLTHDHAGRFVELQHTVHVLHGEDDLVVDRYRSSYQPSVASFREFDWMKIENQLPVIVCDTILVCFE